MVLNLIYSLVQKINLMHDSNTSKNLATYIQYLPEVKKYIAELEHQDLWWSTVAVVGKVNSQNIDSQLLDSIVNTQEEFTKLRQVMINTLIGRYLNQATSEVTLKAQAVIDILIRNLFERTADVGFLATDEDLVDFMAKPEVTDAESEFIHQRIVEYVAKYSVYDDVLLVTPSGEVKSKLDENNPAQHSQDPLLNLALTSNQDYIEVYRYSDLFPHKPNSLIYAKNIQMERNGEYVSVGVLCLRFNFDDELERLFETLGAGGEGYNIMVLDDGGKILASNDQKQYPLMKQHVNPEGFESPQKVNEMLHFATKTVGYQGFKGLSWYGYVSVPNQIAFSDKSSSKDLNVYIKKGSPLYLNDLDQMNLKVSTLLLIVILNGKIISLKGDVKTFLPVLDNFQQISIDIQDIFSRFIDHIHNVLVKTIQGKVVFSATLSVEVMDRNLYERANDCRWWALNSTFRKLLSQHVLSAITSAETSQLTKILQYINDLYTVYTNILLYDTNGQVLAVSNPLESKWVGKILPGPQDFKRSLVLTDTQHYVVSDFHKSELYDSEYTYIYHAPVKSWENLSKNVGGVALVFDSKPEFEAMLMETAPKYLNQDINETTFSVFIDRQARVISSTTDLIEIDSILEGCDGDILAADNGANDTVYWNWRNKPFLVGYKVSEGYREFKNNDGYSNDVIALVFTGI